MRLRPPVDRFWEKVDKTLSCWIWTAQAAPNGYGGFWAGPVINRHVRAHRWAWEERNGPVPAVMQLDHLCRNRRCVNPDHMEAVTQSENSMRGVGATARNMAKTTCPRGHADWGRSGTGRRCMTCQRARLRLRYIRPSVGATHD